MRSWFWVGDDSGLFLRGCLLGLGGMGRGQRETWAGGGIGLTAKVLDAKVSAPRSRKTPHRKGCLDNTLISHSELCL